MADSMIRLPTEKKAAFKIKYQQSYLNYGFIVGDTFSKSFLYNSPLQQSHETFRLLHHGNQAPTLQDKPLEFVKEKNQTNHEQQSPSLHQSMSTLRVSLLVANRIAKARSP